jgi:hypothetical protein
MDPRKETAMTRNRWKAAASSLMALTLVATLADGALAEPRKKGIGKTVESSEITDGTIECEDISPDRFTTPDQELPSTASATNPAASIAKLEVDEGSQIIFASIVWSGSPTNFSGIVTCILIPPNGPTSKAEFIGAGVTVGTLFAQTTNTAAGVVDFRCTDADPGSSVTYRFVQLTAIPVPSLTRTNLLP